MSAPKHDIVYIVRDGANEELRYSLRSVEKNFRFRRVIIYGGKPDDIHPDKYVHVNQHGATRYEMTRNVIRQACDDNDITPDFWLFNDDFFIMRPLHSYKTENGGLLWDHIDRIERGYGITEYTKQLRHLLYTLERQNRFKCPKDYDLHKPMLINRAKMAAVIDNYPDETAVRSLYGNVWDIHGPQGEDCKFGSAAGDPKRKDIDIISTSDEAFKGGDIGVYIRDQFPDRSRFEE